MRTKKLAFHSAVFLSLLFFILNFLALGSKFVGLLHNEYFLFLALTAVNCLVFIWITFLLFVVRE